MGGIDFSMIRKKIFIFARQGILSNIGVSISRAGSMSIVPERKIVRSAQKNQNAPKTTRSVSFHIYEEFIKRAKELNRTRGYYLSQRKRKQIEELFGEAKEYMGLRRARYRGLKFIREQVAMTATAQNIKRMVKLLSRGGPKTTAVAISQTDRALYRSGLNSIVQRFVHFIAYMERVVAPEFAGV